MKLNIYGLSDIGKLRDYNEDSFYLSESPFLACVCDGMGGHLGGEVASAMVVDVFNSYDILKNKLKIDHEAYISNAGMGVDENNFVQLITYANASIYQKSQEDTRLHGMGTTAVAFYVRNNKEICIVNVGDSSAYFATDQLIRQITQDHSWVEEYRQLKMLDELRLDEERMGHVVTRAVGTDPKVDVDFFKEPLKEGVYLLCSDGLNGILSDASIWGVLKTNDNIEIKAKALVSEANCAGGTDNITVVLLEVRR